MAALVSVWRCYLKTHFLCVNGFGHENGLGGRPPHKHPDTMDQAIKLLG